MKTYIYAKEPGKVERLIHTITETSSWVTRKMPKDMWKPDVQLKFAEGVVNDYKARPGELYLDGTEFRIEQETRES